MGRSRVDACTRPGAADSRVPELSRHRHACGQPLRSMLGSARAASAMNELAGREPDRRRYTRIAPKGTVTIHAIGNAHYARLANIGVGGMYVATDVSLPDRLLGRVVGLELRFDGALAAWQRLTGR